MLGAKAKHIFRSFFAVLGLMTLPAHAEDINALLAALDQTKFWDAEIAPDELRERVMSDGVVALFGSSRGVSLDAEDLAEGGIAQTLNDMTPLLASLGVNPPKIETIEEDGYTYRLRIGSKTYDVYTPENHQDSWALAFIATVQIVNDLLPEGQTFYAFYGGHDGYGIIMPPETKPFFDILPKRDRPYIPVNVPPWYGQPH